MKVSDNSKHLILFLYVDDMLMKGNDPLMVHNFNVDMEKMFEITNLGHINYFLVMDVHQRENGIFLSQSKYAWNVLKKFKIDTKKSISTSFVVNFKISKDDGEKLSNSTTFRRLIGSLLSLTIIRSNLMFPTSLVSRYMT